MNAVTPVNVQVPASATAPIVADFVEHAIRVAYVGRRDVASLPETEWAVPGVYVLLTDDGSRKVYVGKSTDLRVRLGKHKSRQAQVPEWSRAVAIKRDTSHGFNSAEVGYLEGRMSAELGALDGLNVVKGKSDGDNTLPPHLRLALDALLPSILAAIRLAGLDTYRADAEPEYRHGAHTASKIRRATVSGTVADLLAAGLLRAGETLHVSQAGKVAQASVTVSGDLVVDGVTYGSPSNAGAVALKVKSCNGWVTWHVGSLDGPLLSELRAKLPQNQLATR